MITFLHVLLAIASLTYITYSLIRPTRKQLSFSYGMVILTLISGILLAVINPAHITQVCTSGILYLAVASVGIIATNIKLANVKSTNL
jgi:hypothetical protein